MGQTLSEQILSHAAGRSVYAGDFVIVQPDVVMSHDSLTPSIIKIMRQSLGVEHIKNPDQAVIVFDHVSPPSTVDTANSQNMVRNFALAESIRLYQAGRGICHQVLVEEEIAAPGKIVIGADSHSTSYGAVGAFGAGMGSTDVALIWATGKTWLRVPHTIQVIGRWRFSTLGLCQRPGFETLPGTDHRRRQLSSRRISRSGVDGASAAPDARQHGDRDGR